MTQAKPVLVLATGNQKKLRELTELAQGAFAVRSLRDYGLADLVIDETGDTFSENARIKANAVWNALHAQGALVDVAAVIADDSGIVVDALDGKPGVRSARFATDHGTGSGDDANNRLLLLLLAPVSDERRTARFVAHVAARVPDGRMLDAEGTMEGHVAHDLEGAGGFGYDPLFIAAERAPRRMAELSPDDKNAISHRGRAMRALLSRLP